MDYHFISLPQSKVAYLDPAHGKMIPILLLHGLGSDATSWELQFPVLVQAGFRPIAIDMPGFGLSSFEGKKWSIHHVAVILNEFVGQLNLPAFHLAGISMGGTVALEYAIQDQTRLRSLVLINTFARLRPHSLSQGYYLGKRWIKAQLFGYQSQAEDVARRIFPDPDQFSLRALLVEQIRRADPAVYKAAMTSLGLFDRLGRLDSIDVPTLVISGQNDSTVSLVDQKSMSKRIPNARHIIIPDAGHAVIIDQPDYFNREMLNFLEKL